MIAKVCLLLAAVAAAQATGIVGIGAPLLATGHLGSVSAQSTAINHVAPVAVGVAPIGLAIGHGIAAAPLGLGISSLGLGHGLAAGNLRADGIVGHGIIGSRYGGVIGHNAVIGQGLLGLGHGVGLGHGLGLGYGLGHGK